MEYVPGMKIRPENHELLRQSEHVSSTSTKKVTYVNENQRYVFRYDVN